MLGQVRSALALTFRGRDARRSAALTLGVGTVATALYLVILPSSDVGGWSLAALQYLTLPQGVAAAALGYGAAVALAINVGALKRSTTGPAIAGVGGLISAALPSSLCCTSVVPSLLAAVGASAPTILGTTGKIQSIFALYEWAFIAASLTGVALSILLAARNRVASCSLAQGEPPC